jgi:dual specificity phosphatase 12
VHCAMGKSRSATLVCAYLIWKDGLSPAAALEQVCEGRPVCDPNPGFKEQLEVWAEICAVGGSGGGEEDMKKKVYDAWEKTRFTGEVWEWEARMKQRREQEQEQEQERGGKSKL